MDDIDSYSHYNRLPREWVGLPRTTSTMTTLTFESSRRARLKTATRDTHGVLDQRIMAFKPFADRARYTAFVHVQYRLHRDVEALYADPALNALLPGLRERSRLALVAQDLVDLGSPVDPAALPAPAFLPGVAVEVPTALGWLYTVEGSNIGAAFLLKAAAGLGLDARLGARHLAPHPDGRAAHWRDFIAQFDEVVLPLAQEPQVEDGARAAFGAALKHAQARLTLAGDPS